MRGSAFKCVPYPGVGERLANVEVSLRGHHDHAVHAASQGHLGEGEDEGGGVRLYHPDVVHRHVRHRVQEGHPTLNIED